MNCRACGAIRSPSFSTKGRAVNPHQNLLLAALPAPDFARLVDELELVRLPLDEVLHDLDTPWRYVYFPTTAVVSLFYVFDDGEAVEVALVGNEGMIGITLFMGGETLPNRAVVLTAGDGYRLDSAVFKREFGRSGGRRSGALNHLLLRYTETLVSQLAQSMFSLLGVLDNIFEGVITIDSSGTVSAYNKAAEQIFGYTAEEVVGRNVNMLMPEPYRTEHDGYLARYLAGGRPRIIGMGRRVSGRRKDGSEFPMHLSVTEMRQTRVIHDRVFIGLVRDVTLEVAAQQRVEYLARHDPLTGLSNRASLNEELLRACAAADEQRCGLLFIDLDSFKPINDQLGHEAGDAALVAVARRIRGGVDAEDFVGRLGGDEFVVLLPGIADLARVLHVAERLLQSIAEPIHLVGNDCQLSASIGVALLPQHGDTPSKILSAADTAMYAAKRSGKNRIVVWSQELDGDGPDAGAALSQ